MDKLHYILELWQNDMGFRVALNNAKTSHDFQQLLTSRDITLSPSEFKKVEGMLKLKNSKILNTDLEKKINK